MKKLIGLVIFILVLVGVVFGSYSYLISAPSKDDLILEFDVEKGSTYNSIADSLQKEKFIRSALAYKVYLKLNPVEENLEYGRYYLPTNASVKEIINVLKKGSDTLADTISVTFIEGKNMRYIISTITKNFKIDEKEIMDKLNDKEYLDKLIENYWFLTEDIKNKDIYYSLEGYLYPDTYEFYENASVEDIFGKMLDNMESKLEDYKDQIESSELSIHEIITLASIVELEAGRADREDVAGVFYNRLNSNMSFGSDVTCYYGAKMDDWTNGIGKHENDCNGYNTRGNCAKKGIPVGAICNPGVSSIKAVLNPSSHNYYYFVADCNGKTYLNKSYNEHINTINKLVKEGLWCDN